MSVYQEYFLSGVCSVCVQYFFLLCLNMCQNLAKLYHEKPLAKKDILLYNPLRVSDALVCRAVAGVAEWQTQWTQNPPGLTPRGSSSLPSGTIF